MNISPYLSETNLYTVLSFVFDDAIVSRQNRISINNKIFIVDYKVKFPNDKIMFVEFNGYYHYTETKTIIRDYNLREYCLTNDIILVEIPYFVQLFSHNFYKYFQKDLLGKVLTTDQPSGFIVNKTILPYDYCIMGVKRFLDDISPNDLTTQEIITSLINRSDYEVDTLKQSFVSINESISKWSNFRGIF